MTSALYDVNDPNFLDDLRASRAAVQRAAEWLSGEGYPVIVRPTFERPDVEYMAEYSDNGDLEILQRVEVKRRVSLTFASLADFRYPTIIVDVCHAYDRAHPKPFAHIIFNRDMSACFLIGRKTRKHWQRVTKLDRLKNRERHFYECPIEFAVFKDFST